MLNACGQTSNQAMAAEPLKSQDFSVSSKFTAEITLMTTSGKSIKRFTRRNRAKIACNTGQNTSMSLTRVGIEVVVEGKVSLARKSVRIVN